MTSVELWKIEEEKLKGIGFLIEYSDTIFSEQISIEFIDEEIYYTVRHNKSEIWVSFKLIKLQNNEAIFENMLHDYPQRIIYRLSAPDILYAHIEGNKNGKQTHTVFNWKKVIQ